MWEVNRVGAIGGGCRRVRIQGSADRNLKSMIGECSRKGYYKG